MAPAEIKCEYCGKTFHGERPYLSHLNKKHYEELGTIDKRRIENKLNTPASVIPFIKKNIGAIVIGILLIIAGVSIYVSLNMQSPEAPVVTDGIQEPGQTGTAHDHATMSVSVDGEHIDFSQSQYQLTNSKVHFENGDGNTLHLPYSARRLLPQGTGMSE